MYNKNCDKASMDTPETKMEKEMELLCKKPSQQTKSTVFRMLDDRQSPETQQYKVFPISFNVHSGNS